MIARSFGWIIIAAVVCGVFVWEQNHAALLGIRVADMKHETERWSQDNIAWKLKVQRLVSMERLYQIAQDRKLINPDDKTTIFLQ